MTSMLLIDDEPALRATLRELLEAAAYTVLEASDGQAGGRVCQAPPVDLVLTDLLMPGQDGFQTIPALRAVRPPLKIIAITGAAPMDGRDLYPFAQQVGGRPDLAEAGAVRRAVCGDPDVAGGERVWSEVVSFPHGPCLSRRETPWAVCA
jgi:two-component system, chemotaxis family, chemotaxis protein CheY